MKRSSIAVSLLVAAAATAVWFFLIRSESPEGAALATRRRAMELLGAQIAKFRPDSKVLVLSNPFSQSSGYLNEKAQYDRASLRGLKRGLGAKSDVAVVFPEVRADYLKNPQTILIPPDSRTPLSFLIQPESVDRLVDAHPGCNVIVSLIGLPTGVEQLKVWSEKDSRTFALLLPDLRLLGSPAEVLEAFQRGKLLAVVAEDSRSGEPMIVTSDNAAEVLHQQPKALGF